MEGEELLLKTPEDFGQIVRSRRKVQKFTQKGLADFVGLSRVSIVKLENESGDIKLSSLLKIADCLKLGVVVKNKSE